MTDKKTGNENYGGGVRQKQDHSHQPNTREQRGAISHHLEQEIAPLTHPGKNKIMGHIHGPFKSYLFLEVR